MMAFVCRHRIDSLVHFQWTVCAAHARAHSQGSCPSSCRSMAFIFGHLIYSGSLQRPDQSVWCLDVRWKISLASSCFIDRNHSMAPPSCFQPRNLPLDELLIVMMCFVHGKSGTLKSQFEAFPKPWYWHVIGKQTWSFPSVPPFLHAADKKEGYSKWQIAQQAPWSCSKNH